MKQRILEILSDLTRIDAPSKNEGEIASFTEKRLISLGLAVHRDAKGNVIGFLDGLGDPILLNAHLDRVLPGKGHSPVVSGDIVKSDGTTNLGSDDTAGITIILEALHTIKENNLHHPPVVVAFTVEEEIGLWGAKALDLKTYKVTRGITYDNAFEAGTVVSRGAAYIAVDIELKGKSVHPGKDLKTGANVIQMFREADFPIGETDNEATRINLGTLIAGAARNAVPDLLTSQCEIRSFLPEKELMNTVNTFTKSFETAAHKAGGSAVITTKQLAVAYNVDPKEQLLQEYRKVIEKRGRKFMMKDTFIASDANALRGEKGLKIFVASTGVSDEHSREESVKLSDLELVTNDLLTLLVQL